MADLFLDIRDRHIRAIISTNGEILFQKAYPLAPKAFGQATQSSQYPEQQTLEQGELASVVAVIRNDSGINLDVAHVILPSSDIQRETHRLPRMPHQDAITLITRKMAEKTGDESPQLSVIPMAIDQNQQEWLAEYVPTETLKNYKSEFDSARLKFKTATTALDSTLHALDQARESIFNAHAVFEINSSSIEAYYISSTDLLLHETLALSNDDDSNSHQNDERANKRRIFSILDILYRINSHYQVAHPMTPLQKIWLCGTELNILELSATLQDAMDVETTLLSSDDTNAFSVLRGFLHAYQRGHVTNFIHPDLLRRFPLRKKTGLLVYIATAILTVFFIATAEYRHIKLSKQVNLEKKNLAEQKKSQAASASFAKNMDLLKKLTNSQKPLYPIFRELATSLPDGVYLESFNFSSKEAVDTIDITATFLHTSDLGTTKTLSRLMDVVKQSPYLKNYREPSVTSSTKALNKNMIVKFSCEVHPLDTAK
jgi:Tfp pilus assembly protein PilN